jgi:hypothetical protein
MHSSDFSTTEFLQRLERPRFWSGQLLTADDFQAEQDYFRNRLRRHNILLHGWGIVCGLKLSTTSEQWKVFVEPGYAIDPRGEDVVVDVSQAADIRPHWKGEASGALYVAIRYRATPTRGVPSPSIPDVGGEGAMQYSRWLDAFELALLDQIPTWEGRRVDRAGEAKESDDPWVVLGSVTGDPDGKIVLQDCPQRRNLRRD